MSSGCVKIQRGFFFFHPCHKNTQPYVVIFRAEGAREYRYSFYVLFVYTFLLLRGCGGGAGRNQQLLRQVNSSQVSGLRNRHHPSPAS